MLFRSVSQSRYVLFVFNSWLGLGNRPKGSEGLKKILDVAFLTLAVILSLSALSWFKASKISFSCEFVSDGYCSLRLLTKLALS